MRIVIFNIDYPVFIAERYLARPDLFESSYAEQMADRNASLFGVGDFYSRNFIAHGHDAIEIHVNNPWMQYAWMREHGLDISEPKPPQIFAREHGAKIRTNPSQAAPSGQRAAAASVPGGNPASFSRKLRTAARPALRILMKPFNRPLHRLRMLKLKLWYRKILRAQIAHFRPDVILNQDLAYLRQPAVRQFKKPGRLLLGQIASMIPTNARYDVYDLVISSLPNQVEWFRKQGVHAELNRLAFDPSVLDHLGPPPPRDIPLSFVGSLSPDHVSRIAFLEYLATRTPLKVWGNGIERLPRSSPLHACYQGEAWGRDMYAILRRSRVTLNFHIDLSEGWANNMRLYEATGVGTLLLTDMKRNLGEIFTPGEHVVTYENAEDCLRQIERLLADDVLREKIAAAGQRHTLAVHSYFARTGEILDLIKALR